MVRKFETSQDKTDKRYLNLYRIQNKIKVPEITAPRRGGNLFADDFDLYRSDISQSQDLSEMIKQPQIAF